MEYCAEVAVFQSACALADKSYPGGLKEFKRYGHDAECVRKIVGYSVAEITRGLDSDLPCSQTDHWNLMLTALSAWRTISCVPKLNAVLPADDLVTDFVQLLPEWNFSFFYDLIKHGNWIQHFLQVIDATRKTAGLLLVQLVLDELNGNDLDAGDIQIVTGILEYFAVIENKYMSCLTADKDSEDNGLEMGDNAHGDSAAVSPGTKRQSSVAAIVMSGRKQDVSTAIQNGQQKLRILMCDENFVSGRSDAGTKAGGRNIHTSGMEDETSLGEVDSEEAAVIEVLQKCFQKALSVDLSKLTCISDSSRLLIAVLNLANFFVGGSVAVFRNHCLFESYSLCPQHVDPDRRKAGSRLLTDDEFKRLIALNIVERPLLYVESPGFSDSLLTECMHGVNKIIATFSESLLPVRDYLCQTKGAIEVSGVLVVHPVLRLDCYRRIILNAYGCLAACVGEPEVDGFQQSVQFLADLCVSRVSQCVQSLESLKEDPMLEFERALVVIEQNFVGGKEHFEYLIETDCIEIMKDPRWLKCLVNYWESFLVLKTDTVLNLLRALKTLKQHLREEHLNRLQQLILKVYSRLSLDKQIDVLTLLYRGSDPSPFNVNSNDFSKQLLNAQSKLMTSDVQHIDDTDVANDFSFLVFQRPLETLDRLILVAAKNKQHVDLVAKMFLQLPILTELENKNGDLVFFETISHWLWMAETFKDEERNAIALCRHLLKSHLNDRSLHLTQQFLQRCIVSHASQLNMNLNSAANLLYADLTLELIQVVCESLSVRHLELEKSPVESHSVAPLMVWLCQVIDSCRNLWLNWNQYCLQKTVLKEKAVMALGSLLETVVSSEEKMPNVQIQWLLQRLSHLHWTIPLYVHPLFNSDSGHLPLSFPEPLARVLQGPNNKSTVLELPELVALFEFCRISDATLEVALNSLALPDITRDYHNFYSKVTLSLARVLLNSILPEWFRIGQMLKQLLSDYFIQRKIHVFNDLAICKVFADAVLLIKDSAPEYSDGKFISIWQHLTNAFAVYFKSALQTVDQVQFAKVGIGLVIRFICIVPKIVTHPLDILVADIISGLKTDSAAIAEIRLAFAEVDHLIDMATSKAILDQIVV